MKVIIIDCRHFTSKECAHDYIAKKLGFPKYYGKNLDALFDSLTELDRSIGIILTNADLARDFIGDYADRIFCVFGEAYETKFRVIIM